MREMRVKGEYIHHEQIKGAMGIKISAQNLEQALAGTELLRVDNEEDLEDLVLHAQSELTNVMDKYIDKSSQGVCVQASTLGSLEALLEFLKTLHISVCYINIGPVHKKDVMKAFKSLTGVGHMKEYASILAFDVKVTPEAQEFAEENQVKIFTDNVMYHLTEQFDEYVKKCKSERKGEEGSKAVFPVLLEVIY
jgi:translation initiation factor 5B